MRTLDRYVLRETLAPFALALLVLTFILIIPFIIAQAETMIAKGVPWLTVAQVMGTLLPQALGLTIPMALLVALLVALGRLSGDREVVAMLACGLSPLRLLRPALVLGIVAWAATSWVMLWAIPDANQTFREITTRLVADRAEGEVKPRVFFEDFPGFVVYVREVPAAGGWTGVLAADTRYARAPGAVPRRTRPHARRPRPAHDSDGAHRRHPPCDVSARSRRLRGGALRRDRAVARSRERVPARRAGARRTRDDDRRAADQGRHAGASAATRRTTR